MDSVHFVLGSFLGFLWSFTRIFVKAPSGRQRLNILGALNACTKELLTIVNDTYITSIQVCEMLDKIALNTASPVTIVLDNARYQRCNLVMDKAKALNIELLFLPPYSPNLNLIERLWKFIRKHCLNAKYYPEFSSFKEAINGFMLNMNKTHQKDLLSLLTLNFQTFKEEQMEGYTR